MIQQLPKWWRLVCLAHFVIALIFGISFLFLPGIVLNMLGWTIVDPFIDRILGGALLAMAWAHFLSAKEITVEKIIIPVQFYFIFDLIGTIVSVWTGITYAAWSGWMMMVIFGFFLIAYCLVIFRK